MRSIIRVAFVREYTYAHAAIRPDDGALGRIGATKMDTLTMGAFLKQVLHEP